MTAPTSLGVVAHYNLLERLDPIGPGDVYRARDTHHGRTVIVRLLPPSSDHAADSVLLAQAQQLVSLSHPNVVTLFGAGRQAGRVYLAFERVTGRSLRTDMAGQPMNARRAVELATEVADAVAEAHALGFVHSGLSPDAIGVTAKGHAKIPAFHLATLMGFEGAGGEARLIDYVSPEEARGEPPDERSDVYSIGAVLYEMLTARRPMHRGASAPGAANVTVPPAVDDVVLRAVAPNPDRRYQTAAALAAALRSVVALLELPDVPADLVVHGDRSASAARLGAIAAVILTGVALVVWWLTRS